MRTLWCFSSIADEAAEHADRLLLVRLIDLDLLEAALEGGVGLEVLLVLREGRGRDGAQLAARERRLQEIGGVVLPCLPTGADHRVSFVDEEDDRDRRALHLVDDALQAVFELPLHPGTGLQETEVERVELHVLERLRHVAADDAEGKPFDDGGLADARVAGEDRVVLPSPRQDVDDLPDFVIAADHRIDAAGARLRGQVHGELVERRCLAAGGRRGLVAGCGLRAGTGGGNRGGGSLLFVLLTGDAREEVAHLCLEPLGG